MLADTIPLFRAVKKEEPHTLKPIIRNAIAYKRNPCTVIASKSAS